MGPTGVRAKIPDGGETVMIVADRFDHIALRYAPTVTFDDRRPGMGARVVGREDNVEQQRVVRSFGLTSIDNQVVAIRGDRLALVASQWHAGYDVEFVTVLRINADGLFEYSAIYDVADLIAAIGRFVERVIGASA